MAEKQKKSKKQEMRITRSLKEIKEDAKRVIASGALWFSKSDVVSERFRVECKTKLKPSQSITLKKEWFEKIQREAFESGKIGLVAFSFGDGKDYIAIDMDAFLGLVKSD